MTTREALARHMFDRRCHLDGAEPAMIELAWADPNIQAFWTAEAGHALAFLTGVGDAAA